ncbi:phosphotransferase [Proteus sp. FME41]|uniref:phosphotransferase n=1 Tax=Proteus sp. FME41 TaxID=2742608 RepID=UPI001D031160|nr:phosphotransferase [Proteus sp. FME41]
MSDPHYLSLLNALQALFPAMALSKWKVAALEGSGGGAFRVQYADIDWVARYYGDEKKALYVHGRKEYVILKQLAGSNLSPKVAARYKEWFFLYWLPGKHLTHQSLFSTYLKPLAEKIATLHQQTPLGFPLNLNHELSVYWQGIDKKRLSARWLGLQQYFLRQPRCNLIKYAPAHMDLHVENILLGNSGIKFIDWEYAADIDTADSLMTFFATNQLNEIQQNTFLDYYCSYHCHYTQSKEISFYSIEELRERILSREPFIFYMMLMWYEVRWQQTKDESFLIMSEPLRHYFSLMN